MTIIKHDFQGKKKAGTAADKKSEKIPGFQLRISLSYSSPLIWRTVNVPGTLTLEKLHRVIQICFGWDDEATHRFMVGKIFYSPYTTDIDRGIRSDADVELHELEKSMAFIFNYLYDGGCGWECEITPLETLPDSAKIPQPVVVAADRACPPPAIEDIHEYQQLLANLELSENGHNAKLLKEYDLTSDFDPSYCDRTLLNEKLQNIV